MFNSEFLQLFILFLYPLDVVDFTVLGFLVQPWALSCMALSSVCVSRAGWRVHRLQLAGSSQTIPAENARCRIWWAALTPEAISPGVFLTRRL